jgi:NitT/TauT family transport system substrate-binding protein
MARLGTGVWRLNRRAALGFAGAALLPLVRRANAQTLDKLSFQTDWQAEAEHGGYYQAVAAGIYKRFGIECDLRQGGPNLNTGQLLLAGRVDMIMSNSFAAFTYARENAPFHCIAAIFQKDPQVFIGHPGTGLDFTRLAGKTLLIGAGGRATFWPFLRKKYGLRDEQLRPYTFNMAPFLADRNVVQQGFVSSEPYAIQQALGRKPEVLLLADAGFAAYNATIDIARKATTDKKDLIQRFVDATLEGWAQYMKGGPAIEAANALIKKHNPDMTDDKIEYAIRVMNESGIVMSGDALQRGIGAMSDARWEEFYRTMAAVDVLPQGLDWKRAYSLDFVNKGIGKPT